jgi:hypothetical protein
MDNLNTHRLKSLTDLYGPERGLAIWSRFTVHYTPNHASWLNQAEIAISLFSRQCLGKRRFAGLPALTTHADQWTRRANRHRVHINWQFTRKAARKRFGYNINKFRRSEN